jgi:hypothetical protein
MATSDLNLSQSVVRDELEKLTVPQLAQLLEKFGYRIEDHWFGDDLLADDDQDAIVYRVLKDGTAITGDDFNTREGALTHARNLVMENWTEQSWEVLHDFRKSLASE